MQKRYTRTDPIREAPDPESLTGMQQMYVKFDTPFRILDTLILARLNRDPSYIYDIETHIHHITLGRIYARSGAVYKAMQRLIHQGYATSMLGTTDRRKYYDITRRGQVQLGQDLALLRRFLENYDLRIF